VSHNGSSVSQPGRDAARLRRLPSIGGLLAWPIATGVFFAIVTIVAVPWTGGDARVLVTGALVGLAMFAANAIAIYVAHTAPRVTRVPQGAARPPGRE
jgi:hypothetical protein